jgi:beta-glucanase (GH16 family)
MAVNLDDQFNDKARLVHIKDFNGFPNTADWVVDRSPGTREHAVIENDKLVLKLNRVEKHPTTGGGIGATVHSSRWMKYGTIEARLKTASNMPGTVSSFILISPISGDEIDFEVVGKDPSDMQTNFYYRVQPGNKVDYSHGVHVNVGLDTSLDYHTYRLDWTPTEMKWWFDGELKRTTLASEVVGSYPDTPMRIAFGIWDGGHGEKGKTFFCDILASFSSDMGLNCLVFRHSSPSVSWNYLNPLSSLFHERLGNGHFFFMVSITTVVRVASSCV